MNAVAINHFLVNYAQYYINEYMLPFMIFICFIAVVCRLLVYYTIKSEMRFTNAFDIRLHRYIDGEYEEAAGLPFLKVMPFLLKKTMYEIYEMRAKRGRRKMDKTHSLVDRIFMIEIGARRLSEDTQLQVKYFNRDRQNDFETAFNYVFSSNPIFNRLFGLVPINLVDGFLSILPGLFIIGGILGTFLGVIGGIPALKSMDLSQASSASQTLNVFLENMGFALVSSVMGIVLSGITTVANTVFSVYDHYLEMVDKYKASIKMLWESTEDIDRQLEIDKKLGDKQLKLEKKLEMKRRAEARKAESMKMLFDKEEKNNEAAGKEEDPVDRQAS